MTKATKKRLLRFSFLLAIVLCLTLIPTFAEGELQETQAPTAVERIGEVVGGTINIRTGPSTYSARITLVYTGKQVKILGEESDWYHIQFDDVDGYIFGEYLKEITPVAQTEPIAEPTVETGTVVGGTINIRTGPSTDYARITLVYTGKQVNILGEENGWYHVQFDNVDGYICGQYLQKNATATTAPVATDNTFGAKVVALARQYLGVPYVYGGSTPSGFDCSGFTMYIYNLAGVSLPHTATEQFYQHGSPVEKADLQVGDAVFFFRPGTSTIGHVGIYIGDGNFIHARTSIARVSIDSLNSTYYRNYYAGAKRMK